MDGGDQDKSPGDSRETSAKNSSSNTNSNSNSNSSSNSSTAPSSSCNSNRSSRASGNTNNSSKVCGAPGSGFRSQRSRNRSNASSECPSPTENLPADLLQFVADWSKNHLFVVDLVIKEARRRLSVYYSRVHKKDERARVRERYKIYKELKKTRQKCRDVQDALQLAEIHREGDIIQQAHSYMDSTGSEPATPPGVHSSTESATIQEIQGGVSTVDQTLAAFLDFRDQYGWEVFADAIENMKGLVEADSYVPMYSTPGQWDGGLTADGASHPTTPIRDAAPRTPSLNNHSQLLMAHLAQALSLPDGSQAPPDEPMNFDLTTVQSGAPATPPDGGGEAAVQAAERLPPPSARQLHKQSRQRSLSMLSNPLSRQSSKKTPLAHKSRPSQQDVRPGTGSSAGHSRLSQENTRPDRGISVDQATEGELELLQPLPRQKQLWRSLRHAMATEKGRQELMQSLVSFDDEALDSDKDQPNAAGSDSQLRGERTAAVDVNKSPREALREALATQQDHQSLIASVAGQLLQQSLACQPTAPADATKKSPCAALMEALAATQDRQSLIASITGQPLQQTQRRQPAQSDRPGSQEGTGRHLDASEKPAMLKLQRSRSDQELPVQRKATGGRRPPLEKGGSLPDYLPNGTVVGGDKLPPLATRQSASRSPLPEESRGAMPRQSDDPPAKADWAKRAMSPPDKLSMRQSASLPPLQEEARGVTPHRTDDKTAEADNPKHPMLPPLAQGRIQHTLSTVNIASFASKKPRAPVPKRRGLARLPTRRGRPPLARQSNSFQLQLPPLGLPGPQEQAGEPPSQQEDTVERLVFCDATGSFEHWSGHPADDNNESLNAVKEKPDVDELVARNKALQMGIEQRDTLIDQLSKLLEAERQQNEKQSNRITQQLVTNAATTAPSPRCTSPRFSWMKYAEDKVEQGFASREHARQLDNDDKNRDCTCSASLVIEEYKGMAVSARQQIERLRMSLMDKEQSYEDALAKMDEKRNELKITLEEAYEEAIKKFTNEELAEQQRLHAQILNKIHMDGEQREDKLREKFLEKMEDIDKAHAREIRKLKSQLANLEEHNRLTMTSKNRVEHELKTCRANKNREMLRLQEKLTSKKGKLAIENKDTTLANERLARENGSLRKALQDAATKHNSEKNELHLNVSSLIKQKDRLNDTIKEQGEQLTEAKKEKERLLVSLQSYKAADRKHRMHDRQHSDCFLAGFCTGKCGETDGPHIVCERYWRYHRSTTGGPVAGEGACRADGPDSLPLCPGERNLTGDGNADDTGQPPVKNFQQHTLSSWARRTTKSTTTPRLNIYGKKAQEEQEKDKQKRREEREQRDGLPKVEKHTIGPSDWRRSDKKGKGKGKGKVKAKIPRKSAATTIRFQLNNGAPKARLSGRIAYSGQHPNSADSTSSAISDNIDVVEYIAGPASPTNPFSVSHPATPLDDIAHPVIPSNLESAQDVH